MREISAQALESHKFRPSDKGDLGPVPRLYLYKERHIR